MKKAPETSISRFTTEEFSSPLIYMIQLYFIRSVRRIVRSVLYYVFVLANLDYFSLLPTGAPKAQQEGQEPERPFGILLSSFLARHNTILH